MIRPAVESALAVARAGLTADPIVPPPPALKRYLGFSKLSSRSLEAIARIVERDDTFRSRVADAVEEDQVGRAGWLWLARPDGWSDELDRLEAVAASEAAELQEQKAERSASKQLAAAQEAVRRAEAQIAAQLVELEELRAQLIHEHEARASAEVRAEELAGRVESVTAARGEAIRNLKDTEVRLVDRTTEAKAAKARIRALEAEMEERRRAAVVDPADDPADDPAPAPPSGEQDLARVPGVTRGVDIRRRTAPGSGPDEFPGSPLPSPPAAETGSTSGRAPAFPEAVAGVDPVAIVGEVARAAQGAAGLASALNDLAALLAGGHGAARTDPRVAPAIGDGARDTDDGSRVGADGVGLDRAGADPVGIAAAPEQARVRREPVVLPGGMFDDTVEAAEHLLRTPGATLVVDGYNVTMEGWPELGAAAQRRRLVVALSDLAARTSTRVELVFDGAEVEPLTVPAPTRPLVRVRFSAPGVEADDVVIDLVGRIPAATPVIVASSDNRVRAGSRRWGANLIHARQLVDVLRR